MDERYPDYIIHATNRIDSILLQTVEPSSEDLRVMSSLTCNTLRRVIAQAEVSKDLATLAKRQDMFRKEFREICGNVDHFVRGFCKIEEKVLISAGFKEAVAKSFLERAKVLRESIMSQVIDPEAILENIKKLPDESCFIAYELHSFPERQQEEREFQKRIARIAYGVGGIAIVAIDAGPLAANYLSHAGSAVSGALGSRLIGLALQ